MKHLSIRLKITLWFAAGLIVIVALTFLGIISVSEAVIHKTIRDELVVTVDNNLDEVEFFTADTGYANDVDHYIRYGAGYLEIDDDFLDKINNVYTALYDEGGQLYYGENPIAKETGAIAFADAQIHRQDVNGTLYYVYDRKLQTPGLEGFWLRGVVSEEQGDVQMSAITRWSLILLPLIAVLAIGGGYWLAGKALKPIKDISKTAMGISSGNDLKRRIEIGTGRDELHVLAELFNGMLERLEKSFDSERQFTADASHELRTPISVIMAQCEYSLEKTRGPEEYEKALEVIQRQGRKLSGLVEDMLTFTRLEQKADSYVMQKMNLSELVHSVCGDMALIQEKGIILQWEAQEEINVRGSQQLIIRLLTNLITNAYRYGKENGHIFIRLERAGGMARLLVQDDGIGIAREDQEKIFSRFYQADSSHSGRGTGLGLSIAREIAHIHGGEITVESVLGSGSVFTFTLPEYGENNKI